MFPESVDRERKNMPFSMFQQQMDIAYLRATVYKRTRTKYKISHRKEKSYFCIQIKISLFNKKIMRISSSKKD